MKKSIINGLAKKCTNCNAIFEEEDLYCRYCGSKREKGIFYQPSENIHGCIYGPPPVKRIHTCNNCGYEWSTFKMIDRENYCPRCGEPITTTEIK